MVSYSRSPEEGPASRLSSTHAPLSACHGESGRARRRRCAAARRAMPPTWLSEPLAPCTQDLPENSDRHSCPPLATQPGGESQRRVLPCGKNTASRTSEWHEPRAAPLQLRNPDPVSKRGTAGRNSGRMATHAVPPHPRRPGHVGWGASDPDVTESAPTSDNLSSCSPARTIRPPRGPTLQDAPDPRPHAQGRGSRHLRVGDMGARSEWNRAGARLCGAPSGRKWTEAWRALQPLARRRTWDRKTRIHRGTPLPAVSAIRQGPDRPGIRRPLHRSLGVRSAEPYRRGRNIQGHVMEGP